MKTDPFEKEYNRWNSGTNAEKYADMRSFPEAIEIELTNTCNMACAMCPTGVYNLKKAKGGEVTGRQSGFMDEFTYLKIIGEVKNYDCHIRFARFGEPTLHPHFWRFVRMANELGIKIHLVTNGTILRELKEKIDAIKMSLHANSKRGREGVNALITMNTFKTASITDKEAEQTGIDITKYPFTELDNAKQYRQCYEGIKAPRPTCCSELYNKLSINWDGSVSACCNDHNNLMVIGDLHNNTLKELWTCDKMEHYRKLAAEEKHWNLPLCRDCWDLGCF